MLPSMPSWLSRHNYTLIKEKRGIERFRMPWNSGFDSAKIGNEYAVFA